MNVSTGDGRQNFKWLASVVSERLRKVISTKLKVGDSGVVVVGFTDIHGDEIHPIDMIFEYVPQDANTASFIAKTVEQMPDDEYGNPIFSEFQEIAYVTRDETKRYYRELELWKHQTDKNIDYPEDKDGRAPSATLVYVGQLTQQDLDAAYELDWQRMNWFWFGESATDRIMAVLKEIYKSNYSMICQVFSHYCGDGRAQQYYGMSHREFAHLLRVSSIYKLIDPTVQSNIESIFNQTLIEHDSVSPGYHDGKVDQSCQALLTRSELMEALARVSVDLCDKQGGKVTDRLKSILEINIAEMWHRVQKTYVTHCSTDPLMMRTVIEHFPVLSEIYKSYATKHKQLGPGMSLSSFTRLLMDSGVAPSALSSIAEEICARVFSSVQTDISTEGGGSQSRPSSEVGGKLSNLQSELVFAEFIEGIIRVAIMVTEMENQGSKGEEKRDSEAIIARSAISSILNLTTVKI